MYFGKFFKFKINSNLNNTDLKKIVPKNHFCPAFQLFSLLAPYLTDLPDLVKSKIIVLLFDSNI
jgi:hypothetical protein